MRRTLKPIMEINADHPLIKQLAPEHERLEEWSMVLFDQAALSEGARLFRTGSLCQTSERLTGPGPVC